MLVTVNSLLACVDFPDCHSVHLCLDAPLEKPMVLRGRFLAKIPAEAYVTRCWHARLGIAIVWIAFRNIPRVVVVSSVDLQHH